MFKGKILKNVTTNPIHHQQYLNLIRLCLNLCLSKNWNLDLLIASERHNRLMEVFEDQILNSYHNCNLTNIQYLWNTLDKWAYFWKRKDMKTKNNCRRPESHCSPGSRIPLPHLVQERLLFGRYPRVESHVQFVKHPTPEEWRTHHLL
jgi:hypothetical protein